MVNRYHGTLTPPRIAPSRPFKEKTEVSLYPASASSQAAAPHDCYSSPEVAHSLSGGLGVGSCVASQKRKDPQHWTIQFSRSSEEWFASLHHPTDKKAANV